MGGGERHYGPFKSTSGPLKAGADPTKGKKQDAEGGMQGKMAEKEKNSSNDQ